MTIRRPGYREAIEWIALNDDQSCWIEDGLITVSGAMVRDLYNVEPDRILRDIRNLINRIDKMENKTVMKKSMGDLTYDFYDKCSGVTKEMIGVKDAS